MVQLADVLILWPWQPQGKKKKERGTIQELILLFAVPRIIVHTAMTHYKKKKAEKLLVLLHAFKNSYATLTLEKYLLVSLSYMWGYMLSTYTNLYRPLSLGLCRARCGTTCGWCYLRGLLLPSCGLLSLSLCATASSTGLFTSVPSSI